MLGDLQAMGVKGEWYTLCQERKEWGRRGDVKKEWVS